MTRREEIVTATLGCRQNYVNLKRPITPDDVADAFEKGAYWADKTMIEKAYNWLIENMPKYINFEDGFIYEVDMAIDFRKAMQNE